MPQTMNPADLTFLKNNVPLLADFSDAQREEIANGSRVETLQQGERIVHAGDEVHFLGIVLEGTITASVPTSDGGRQALGELRPASRSARWR
jgi:acetate kinase